MRELAPAAPRAWKQPASRRPSPMPINTFSTLETPWRNDPGPDSLGPKIWAAPVPSQPVHQ